MLCTNVFQRCAPLPLEREISLRIEVCEFREFSSQTKETLNNTERGKDATCRTPGRRRSI
jgi:hypothetical protein